MAVNYRDLQQAILWEAEDYQRALAALGEAFSPAVLDSKEDFGAYQKIQDFLQRKLEHYEAMAKACLHKASPPGSRAPLPFLPPYPPSMTEEEEALVQEAERLQWDGAIRTPCTLSEARRGAGLTQRQLAEASGVNIRQIQRIEHGDSSLGNITAANFMALVRALHMRPRDLALRPESEDKK